MENMSNPPGVTLHFFKSKSRMILSEEVLDNNMGNFSKQFKQFNKTIDYYSGILLLILSILVVLNILGRVLFRSPVYGAYEYVCVAMLFIIALSLAHCSFEGGHVNITLLLDWCSEKTRKWVETITGTFIFVNLVIILISLFKYMQTKYITGEKTLLTNIPMSFIVGVALFGFVLLLLSILIKLMELNMKPSKQISNKAKEI